MEASTIIGSDQKDEASHAPLFLLQSYMRRGEHGFTRGMAGAGTASTAVVPAVTGSASVMKF